MSDQNVVPEPMNDQIHNGELLNALMALKKGDFSYRMPMITRGSQVKLRIHLMKLWICRKV